MNTLLQRLRPYVEQWPLLASAYRTLRHRYLFLTHRAVSTPYGFQLYGNPLMASGTYEPEIARLIRHHLTRTDIFIDIGANIGFYTCLAAEQGRQVVAVEPIGENLDYLRKNVHHNHFSNVDILPIALGDSPGTAMLYGAGTGASMIIGWANISPLLRHVVPMQTLDSILSPYPHGARLLIKIDVEGAELKVLTGAVRTLSRVPKPVWLVEITRGELHPSRKNVHYEATFDLFRRNGYECHAVHPAVPETDAKGELGADSGIARPAGATFNYIFYARPH